MEPNSTLSANVLRIRTAKGMSQDKLSKESRVSLSTCKKIESGTAAPRAKTLQALADALGVSLSELLTPVEGLNHVRFRASGEMRTRNQILAEVESWLQGYNQLETLMGDSREYKLEKLPKNTKQVAKAIAQAQSARRALGLDEKEPVHDVCGLLESAGVKVFPFVKNTPNFFGLSVGGAGGGPAIVVNTWDKITVERWIFTAAHELGHLLLHLQDYDDAQSKENPAQEKEADAFAAEFLMPDVGFCKEWSEAAGLSFYDRVMKVKGIYRVSYKVVLHRFMGHWPDGEDAFKFFADERNRLSMRALSKTNEPSGLSEYNFREDRLPRLVRKGVEAGKISLGRGAEVLGMSLREMRDLSASWVS